jgi:predicted transcriptional regulator
MSTTITIRIPKELKEKMDKTPAKWSREVRVFIEARVKQVEMLQNLEEIEKRADKRKTKVDSAVLIREDRER